MSAQEILLEEIKGQPEPVLREVLHYLRFLNRQREEEAWIKTPHEAEREALNRTISDTWDKLGPAPEIDYDKL